jgi:carbon monoxide dehydrogenase subunit G
MGLVFSRPSLLTYVFLCCALQQANAQPGLPSGQSGQLNRANQQVAKMVTEQPQVRVEKRDNHTYVVGSVLINAPRERVWSILVDYDRSPEIFTNLSLCKVIGNEGEVKLVRQVVKPGGPIKFDYVVNLIETKPSLIKWKRRSGSFKEVMGAWELESVAKAALTKDSGIKDAGIKDTATKDSSTKDSGTKDSATMVTYSIHLDGGLALPPWLLASQVKGYLPTVLNGLKVKVESSKQGVKS